MSWVGAYDAVRIVSLLSRTDRRRDVRSELVRIGALDRNAILGNGEARIAFFDAIRVHDAGPFLRVGSHGCFLSHLAIFEEAARTGQSVLILQDDCDFTAAALELRAPPECDIFYGGFELVGPQDRPHDCHVIGAHCMGFSAEAARRAAVYLRALLDPATPPDPLAAATEHNFDPARRPPIDGALVWFRRANPDLVTVFHKVSEQRGSRTDVGDTRLLDRLPLLRDAMSFARRTRRATARHALA